jgi:4-amino-4-deoxy-L-arabinose transferase-like glycosyltransferase
LKDRINDYPWRSWRSSELLLFLCLIAGRVITLYVTFGHKSGFDSNGHIWEVEHFSFQNLLDMDLNKCFYDYHPPLAFCLASIIRTLFGTHRIEAIQIVACIASTVAFLYFRATLRSLKILETPRAIALLYLSSCMPLQIFLAHGINIDVLILAQTSITIFLSIRLFWCTKCDSQVEQLRRMYLYPCLAIVLFSALLTKFSGVLLLPIPFILYLLSPDRSHERVAVDRIIFRITFTIFTAIALAFPYYYLRYVIPTNDFFPNNFVMEYPQFYKEACDKRDADRWKFFITLFAPTRVHEIKGITAQDYEEVHFTDTWRDFWVKNDFLGKQNALALGIEKVYFYIAPWLVLPGMIMFIAKRRESGYWSRIGWFLCSYSFILIVVLIVNIYRNPYSYWYPAKAIYIAPVTWALGYFIACLVPKAVTERKHAPAVMLAIVIPYVVLNHLLPIY